jgi:gluconate 2-dehydrogenase gamma chain
MLPLNEIQLRTLTSAVDRIVPADNFPSASEVGCVEFLLRLIQLENLTEIYRRGLDGLDYEARIKGKSFSDLTSIQQDELIAKCHRRKKGAGWENSPAEFVSLLASQTIEGYYSDPGNGGNRGEVAWRMVGFEVRG